MKLPLLLSSILALTAAADEATVELRIDLANGTEAEAATARQLVRLAEEYDLAGYVYTHDIVIDETAIPHSHPVLTLSAANLKDDELLLSTFVHEQAHWFLTEHRNAQADKAVAALMRIYPAVPTGYPEGARSERSSYVHLIVNYLEYRALRELLGHLRAWQVMEFWAQHHYTWIYRTVLDDERRIARIAHEHELVPD